MRYQKTLVKHLVLLLLLGSCSIDQGREAKPNILIILVDDLGYGDLGFMGNQYIQTPNIDKLANESMQFTQAYTACTVCSPSRASIMCGKNPAAMGIISLGEGAAIPSDEIFLPAELEKAGYQTAAFGKWHLKTTTDDDFRPSEAGFTYVRGVNHGGQPATYFYPFTSDKNDYKIQCSVTDLQHHKDAFLTDALAEEASRFIATNKDNPFFVYMSFYAVHMPIEAKQDKIDKYSKLEKPDARNNPEYAALTESMDEAVGKILNTLVEQGIEDHTVVFFLSDNGGYTPNSNNGILRSGKGSPYEGGIRTPLLVRWPGKAKKGRTSDQLIVTSDLAPTIAEIVGANWEKTPKEGINGYSMLPIIKGNQDKHNREALYWLYYPVKQQYKPKSYRVPAEVIRMGDWKLIHFLKSKDIKDHYELYNLKNDISEQYNLVDEKPEVLRSLVGKLECWRKEIPVPPYDSETYIQEVMEVMESRKE